MLRSLIHQDHDHYEDGFRLRGLGFSRLDGFSDVVFGFALTLLVVSLEVPKDYLELHRSLREFMPFAVNFMLLMLIWFAHFQFFRRYGLHDAGTIWLNGVLLFTVLFYVYPLKFLFRALFEGAAVQFEHASDIRELVLLYSIGFTALYALLGVLYANAYRQRDTLALTPYEVTLTSMWGWEMMGTAFIGVLVTVVALVLPPAKSALATFLFGLIALQRSWSGRRMGKFTRAHVAASSSAAASMKGE